MLSVSNFEQSYDWCPFHDKNGTLDYSVISYRWFEGFWTTDFEQFYGQVWPSEADLKVR